MNTYHGERDEREDEILPDAPVFISQDERRMQVRAYHHWANMLGQRNFPDIADFDPEDLPGFAPHAVLLDFSQHPEDDKKNPAITYLGANLAKAGLAKAGLAKAGLEHDTKKQAPGPGESPGPGTVRYLSDMPERSLLSRIADLSTRSLMNGAPISFEAECVDQHDRTILYRGILLPFSDDDQSVSHILGVINWRELADQKTIDHLLYEIDHALIAPDRPSQPDAPLPEPSLESLPEPLLPESLATSWAAMPLPAWADGPIIPSPFGDSVLDLTQHPAFRKGRIAWPSPLFGASGPDAHPPAASAPSLTLAPGAPSGHLPGMMHADVRSPVRRCGGISPVLAHRLRRLDSLPLGSLAAKGEEFTLLMVHRTQSGMEVLGEISGDHELMTRAAKKLIRKRR